MIDVLFRYRFVVIALSLVLFALLVLMLLLRQDNVKIPARGIFV